MTDPPSSQVSRTMIRSLVLAGAGVLALVAGLAWDAVAHARDPRLVHEETVFTLANPAHALFLSGLVAVVAGVAGALRAGLSTRPGGRLPRAARWVVPVVAAAVLAGTGAALALAARADPPVAAHPPAASHQPEAEHRAQEGAEASAPAGHGSGGDGLVTHGHEQPACRPTASERRAAETLVSETKAGVARYADVARATADGYEPVTPASWPTVHYLHPVRAADGRIVDPTAPEALVYANTARGPVLAAAMFMMEVPGEPGPRIGGCATEWHTHADLCVSPRSRQVVSLLPPGGRCPDGSLNYVPPEMMHLWVVEVPGGPFSHEVDGAALAGRLGR